MRLVLVLAFCLIASSAYSAELLVKAKPHWMDSLSQEEVDKMDKDTRQSYEARFQIGDIIAVRPDGWIWGKKERLPNFIVVKIPGMNLEEAQEYEKRLTKKIYIPEAGIWDDRIIKRRKYQIPKAVIDNAKQLSADSISIDKNDKDNFISNIKVKIE